MIVESSVFHKSESITYRELDGEGVLYDSVNRRMHVLNSTAVDIWILLDQVHQPKQIAEIMAERFNVPNDTVIADVMACLQTFQQLGLVKGDA